MAGRVGVARGILGVLAVLLGATRAAELLIFVENPGGQVSNTWTIDKAAGRIGESLKINKVFYDPYL